MLSDDLRWLRWRCLPSLPHLAIADDSSPNEQSYPQALVSSYSVWHCGQIFMTLPPHRSASSAPALGYSEV